MKKRPFIAYRRNSNLHQLIGGNRIFKKKVVHKNTEQPKQSDIAHDAFQELKSFVINMWNKQKNSKVTVQKKPFKYLQPYIQKWKPNLSTPMPYISTPVRWKKWDCFQHPPSIIIRKMLNHKPQFWHVNITTKNNHNFQQHAEFTLIEQIKKQTTAEETRTPLKRRENFWVLKLKTLYPDELNQKSNNID